MARRGDDIAPVYRAVAALGVGVALHYGWNLVPPEHQAQAWNAAGAVVRAALVSALLWRTRYAVPVVAWWVAEELLVAGCSLAYIASPWPIGDGEAQCQPLFPLDLGRLGILLAALVLAVTLSKVTGGKRD